jgi:hypothetical protein
MAENPSRPPSTTTGGSGRFGRLVGGFSEGLLKLIVRLYALAILLVVIWAGYTAIAFLVRSVFEHTVIPPQYNGWPSALSRGHLRPELVGAEELIVPRSPVEHYHLVERTLPEDLHNGCVTSGCHNALAHTKRKEVRAFANLHATFLACGLCHDASLSGTTPAMWVDIVTGQPTQTPPTLRLMDYLEADNQKIHSAPAEVNAAIAPLLAQLVQLSPDPVLGYIRLQLTTSQPGSPVWRHAMDQLVQELPNHLRGEYGAKLTPRRSAEDLGQRERRLADLTREYLAAPADGPERKKLHDEIHEGILKRPSLCLACHGGTPPRLDFRALGYSPQRAAALSSSDIARQMQQIDEGQPFYLPRLLQGDRAAGGQP